MSLSEDKCHEDTQMTNQTNSCSKRHIIKNLVVVSLGALFILAADDAILTMQSTLNRDKDVGIASVAVQYACSFLTSLLLPKYMVLRYGCKTILIMSIVMFIPFLVVNYYPLYYLMLISSISIGVGYSLLEGALDPYLNSLSRLFADIQIAELQAASRKSIMIEICRSSEPDVKTFSKNDLFFNLDNEPPKECIVFNNINLKTVRSVSSNSTMEKCTYNDPSYHLGKEIVTNAKLEEINLANCIDTKDLETSKKEKSNHINQKNGIIKKEAVLKKNRKDGKASILESTTILFFGLHSLINLSSYIFSNLASYFVLQKGFSDVFVSASPANESCSCGIAYCNVATICSEHNLQQPSTADRNILISACIGSCFLAVLLWVSFLDDLKAEKKSVSFSADMLFATFRQMKKKNQILLIPITMNTGMLMGFYVADFTKSYIGCAWGIQFIGLVTTCSGGGMAIVSLLSGWIAKPFGRRPIFILAAILNVVLIAVLFIWQPNSQYPAMFFVTAGLFGCLYGIYYTQIKAFYGVLFREDQEAAFGAYQLYYCLGSCLSLSYSNYICNEIKLYIFILSSALGLIGYMIVEQSHSLIKINGSSRKI